jgi:aspartyl-tRNA(Asn)/glutamyl-tRNA(Gln) amidotransferase subunit A
MSSPRTEGAALHLDRLRSRASDFDPAVRDRLIAGAMVPATLVNQAQKFRRWYRERVLELFKDVDVILAPATPCTAPRIGQQAFATRRRRDGAPAQHRHLHPARFIHRPAGRSGSGPPHAAADSVQIIAAPWREDVALRVAQALEQAGVASAPRPNI